MGRIENTTYKAVWDRANYYADLWDVKTALSAGIAALDLLSPADREKAVAIAKNKNAESDKPAHADSRYQILSDKESEMLGQFRDAVLLSGPDEALDVVRSAILAHAKAHRKKNPSKSAKLA